MSKKPRKPKPKHIAVDTEGRLLPDSFYRKHEVIRRRLLGYAKTQLHEKIAAGEIEPPIKLSETGVATGWFGRTIIAHQARLHQK